MKRKYELDIDFEDLKGQKQSLLKAIRHYEACRLVTADGMHGKEESENLTGILHLLDAIQDSAVEQGEKESTVFDYVQD